MATSVTQHTRDKKHEYTNQNNINNYVATLPCEMAVYNSECILVAHASAENIIARPQNH